MLDEGVRDVLVDFADIRQCASAVGQAHAAGPGSCWPRRHPKARRARHLPRAGTTGSGRDSGPQPIWPGFFVSRWRPWWPTSRSMRPTSSRLIFCADWARPVTASYDLNREQLLDLAAARADRLAGSGDPPAHADVPHGALRVLRGALAGHEQDQLRPTVRRTLRQAPRSDRHGASVDCRRGLPQHAVQRRTAERRPRPCRPCSTRGLRHFRVELLEEPPDDIRTTLELYRNCWPASCRRRKFGVG